MSNRVNKVILHHTGGTASDPRADTSKHTFEQVDAYHKQKWNFKSVLGHYIAYQWYIEKTGRMTQGRLNTETGAHTIGQNKQSIGIALAGNFDVTLPTKEQVDSLGSLLGKLMKEYALTPDDVYPHREFSSKSCYGKRLPDNWGRELAKKNYISAPPPQLTALQRQLNAIKALLAEIMRQFKGRR